MSPASSFPDLPPDVAQMIASAMFCEFGTISAQGVPIDTPLLCFADPGCRSIDVGTGLAYPTKAERARRNPKVGLLLEGGPAQPVISIGALATVKDANIQANAERYIAEVIAYFDSFSGGQPLGRRTPSRVVLGTHLHTRHTEKYFVVAFTGADERGAAALGCAA
jgi:hypothetical protein